MFSSMFRDLEEDPFFSNSMNMLSDMNRSMFGADPFQSMMMPHHRPAIDQGRHRPRVNPREHGNMGLLPYNMFGGFDSMFGNMRNMFTNIEQQMQQMQNDPNSHCYTQSSVMSYSNDGQGQPLVYQASKSTRKAPGGIKETRHSERDSATGFERIAIGHHLNDRGHVIERSHNRRTGDEDENQEFINIDEEEAEDFDHEWRSATRGSHATRHSPSQGRHRPAAIAAADSSLKVEPSSSYSTDQRDKTAEKTVRITEPHEHRKHDSNKTSGKTRKTYEHSRPRLY